MPEFSTFSQIRSIRELGLKSRAEEVSLAAARQLPSFELPIKLLDLWQRLPIEGLGEPPRAHLITPQLLGAKMLPNMYILDVVDKGRDFRWRLFGTAHIAHYGKEATGLLMADAAKEDTSAASSLAFARQTYNSSGPVFFLTEFFDDTGVVKSNSTVALPLSGDDGTITRLFGCSVWH